MTNKDLHMNKKIIKVFIVDDSRTARELLTHIIESDPELKVVGYAEDGKMALQWLHEHTCDVITMDIHMPYINGFEVAKKIMETKPIPTVIISSGYTPTDNLMAFRALEVGALSILEKPGALSDATYYQKAQAIISTIKMISDIKIMTRHNKQCVSKTKNSPIAIESKIKIKAVGIGASLGGPLAIAQILEDLPSSFPVPIFIVQHIAAGFSKDFIQWLQERSALRICAAKDGEIAQAGCVYVAADKCQMEVKQGGMISFNYTSSSHIQPSVGSLFKSLANSYGSQCIGVILTGMGSDGAKELLIMKQKGAHTIAQDEKSCVMFGMPKEAILLKAASQILPLNIIAHTLNTLVAKNRTPMELHHE